MRRILSALAIAMLLFGLSAPPAPAKGPTHMLLMSPNGGASPGGSGAYEFMELSDSRAQEIEVLLNDLGEKVTEPEYERWHEVQVAWTMHAFEIFRSDIVFLDGKGAAVMMTLRSGFEEPGFSTDWRRVRNGEALTEAFDELGLMDKRAAGRSADDRTDSDTDTSAATTGFSATDPAGTPAASAESSNDGWTWGSALSGLVAGLLMGVVGSGVLRRRKGQAVAQRFASS